MQQPKKSRPVTIIVDSETLGIQELRGAVRFNAKQGDGMSQGMLASYYIHGLNSGIKQNYAKGIEWARKAANQGDSLGFALLSRCYEKGLGIEKNVDKAFAFAQLASKNDHPTGLTALASVLLFGIGCKKNITEAIRLLWLAAQQGYYGAQNLLGYCFGIGLGVGQDSEAAEYFYKLAAEQGMIRAQINMTVSLRDKNWRMACRWVRRAANQGSLNAMRELIIRLNGKEKNVGGAEIERFKWLKTLAAHGDVQHIELGLCFKQGKGVEQDDKKAVEWFRKGMAAGDMLSEINMGRMYEYGRGIKQDLAKATGIYLCYEKQEDLCRKWLVKLAKNHPGIINRTRAICAAQCFKRASKFWEGHLPDLVIGHILKFIYTPKNKKTKN